MKGRKGKKILIEELFSGMVSMWPKKWHVLYHKAMFKEKGSRGISACNNSKERM